MSIHERGYWLDHEGHWHDAHLAHALLKVFHKDHTVADIGCGRGDYVRFLRHHGIKCDGFDGNPLTPQFEPSCKVVDFSNVVDIGQYDWAMSLEVGEHIPPEFEKNFITNLHNANKIGVILSWAIPGQAGKGHFNNQPNEYVKNIFAKLGYINDLGTEQMLRRSSRLWWFPDTLMVFRKFKKV
jgi:cyclopropane fatty-acyl-phospholipid synthase-like methyltransferase